MQVINNFEYSMDSPWATDVPQRTEGSLPTDIFSTMVYVNVCPGGRNMEPKAFCSVVLLKSSDVCALLTLSEVFV